MSFICILIFISFILLRTNVTKKYRSRAIHPPTATQSYMFKLSKVIKEKKSSKTHLQGACKKLDILKSPLGCSHIKSK